MEIGMQSPSLFYESPRLVRSAVYSPKGCHTRDTAPEEHKSLNFESRAKALNMCEMISKSKHNLLLLRIHALLHM